MRRRHRHFNPKAAGAVRAYDSRYVSGTNNTGLGTWTDRSGNANATQATGANQALYIASGQGGNPVIRFDGSNDYFNFTRLDTYSGLTALGCNKQTGDGVLIGSNDQNRGGGSANVQMLRWIATGSGLGNNLVLWYNSADTTWDLSANGADFTTFGITSCSVFGGSKMKTFRNGVTMGDSTRNTLTNLSNFSVIGGVYFLSAGLAAPVNGDVGQVLIFTANLSSSPLRKRLEHAAAYSFKFSCS